MKKALIAMSGGIDSSVTAFLMKQKGYDCTGITFRMFDKTDKLFGFDIEDADKDIRDAENVCKTVGIPFMEYDASEEFRKYVINNFVSVYETGGTPNPCVECNRHIKFRLLYEIADKLGFDVTEKKLLTIRKIRVMFFILLLRNNSVNSVFRFRR